MQNHLECKIFDRNFSSLSIFLNQIWDRRHGKSHINFSERYLKYWFDGPTAIPELLFALYNRSMLVAFLGFTLQEIMVDGQAFYTGDIRMAALLPGYSLISTIPKFKLQLNEVLKKGDFTIDFFHGITRKEYSPWISSFGEGYYNTELSLSLILKDELKDINCDTSQLYSFNESYLKDCLRIANEMTTIMDFGIIWSADQLRHLFSYDGFSYTYVYCKKNEQKISAFANFVIVEVFSKINFKAAYINLVGIGTLNAFEQEIFFQKLLTKIKEFNVKYIGIYNTSYIPTQIINKIGFRKSLSNFFFFLISNNPFIQPPNTKFTNRKFFIPCS